MGEAKTVCNLCGRKPGEHHKKRCARGKNHRIPMAWRKMRDRPYKQTWPIANIFDCVMGPIKTCAIPRGTPTRVEL